MPCVPPAPAVGSVHAASFSGWVAGQSAGLFVEAPPLPLPPLAVPPPPGRPPPPPPPEPLPPVPLVEPAVPLEVPAVPLGLPAVLLVPAVLVVPPLLLPAVLLEPPLPPGSSEEPPHATNRAGMSTKGRPMRSLFMVFSDEPCESTQPRATRRTPRALAPTSSAEE